MSSEKLRPKLQETDINDQIKNRIWDQAARLSHAREELGAYQARLYDEVYRLSNKDQLLSPREQLDLGEKDKEYYRIADKLLTFKDEEDYLEAMLLGIEDGTANLIQLEQLFPEDEVDEKGSKKKLSKRERFREEERERLRKLGFSEFEIEWDLRQMVHGEFGANPTKLTTGRNRHRVKGSFNIFNAESAFFNATADTHGGKVAHGQNSGSTYVTKEGKRVRKK